MTSSEIVLIAIGLSMDAFAVSVVARASGQSTGPRAAFRLSFHFGLFQFLMPVIGWTVGEAIVSSVGAFDHWIAFGLLSFVGARMIVSGVRSVPEELKSDPSRGWTLISLCIATSIDALAVGLSLAMLKVSIWYPSIIIGIITAGVCVLGIQIGRQLGTRFGQRTEILGGVILVLIGLRIVLSH